MPRGKPTRRLPAPKEAYREVPAGLREFLLNELALELSLGQKGDPMAYAREADRISQRLFARNVRGVELERAGKVDRAIDVYEANVADMFGGNHPYDRLRVIYSKRKQYDQALRVCRSFVEMADALMKLGSPRSDLPVKRRKFAEWCAKLEVRVQKQQSSVKR